MPEPSRERRGEFRVIGTELRTNNALEADPTTARIVSHWRRFMDGKLLEQIPEQSNPTTVLGVCTRYASGDQGDYSVVAGAEVNDFDEVPPEMIAVTLPESEYLVFPAPGKLPEAVPTAWRRIWEYFATQGEHARAYTADFEEYAGNPDGPPEVNIYVAIL